MAIIQVNTNELRTTSKQIKKYRATHIQTIQNLRRLILSLNEDWKGDAQDAFVAKYMSMSKDFREFQDMLQDYATLLNRVADKMEATDLKLKNRIAGID